MKNCLKSPFFSILNIRKHCPSPKKEDQILFPRQGPKTSFHRKPTHFFDPATKAEIGTLKWGFTSAIMVSGIPSASGCVDTHGSHKSCSYIPGLQKGGKRRRNIGSCWVCPGAYTPALHPSPHPQAAATTADASGARSMFQQRSSINPAADSPMTPSARSCSFALSAASSSGRSLLPKA